jgi:tRNA-splicing ligase RtcB
MKVTQEEGARPVKVWTDSVEPQAMEQLRNAARMPFIHPHGVVAMPDVHMGIGATVGSVLATERAIIPAAVGVDIGCGMNALRLSLKASDLPDSLAAVRAQIERDVPVGFSMHQREQTVASNWTGREALRDGYAVLTTKHPKVKTSDKNVAAQLGSLGGGNHFVELCLDESGDVWVMLHSGSRGTGNAIGRYFIERAKEECARWHVSLPDDDLAYLPEGTDVFADYVEAVAWAQDYALQNRAVMMNLVLAALARTIPVPFTVTKEAINCHHNYVERENHFGRNVYVTRKGAIRARDGDLGIIPGSMGQRSFIVRGKGNPESYCSCSHGAGRRMSRNEAKKAFSLTDLIAQTEGVECRKDEGVIDEIPGAYKDIDEVMANQTDLVEVLHTLKQVLCVKG